MNDKDATHNLVKKAYGEIARKQSCCRESDDASPCCDSSTSSCCEKGEYVVPDHPVPEAELGLSCGNPIAFDQIRPGDTVLDLGSGAGKDVSLAAQKVGPAGRAIGVDMTPEMLKLARSNAMRFFAATGQVNVEFREGLIEALPVEDEAVDVVISNCVINLSTDKPRVFREAYRVLRPGGRMVVSDIVLNRPLPESVANDADALTACIGGALLRQEYLDAIQSAGFKAITILSDHTYKAQTCECDPITRKAADTLTGVAASITVLATK